MKQTIRCILLTIVAMLLTGHIMAQDKALDLVLILTNNQTVRCAFSQQPEMTFTDNTLTLTTADGRVGQWEFSDVASWSTAESAASDAIISVSEASVTLGRTSGAVYDLSGRIVVAQTSGKELKLSSLPSGTYILRTASGSIKFTIR